MGVSVKVLPETGVEIVAAVLGGGLGIVPCKPVLPDCCGSGLPIAYALPTFPSSKSMLKVIVGNRTENMFRFMLGLRSAYALSIPENWHSS